MDEKIDSGFTKLKESIDDLHPTMINFIVAFECYMQLEKIKKLDDEIKELKRTKGE